MHKATSYTYITSRGTSSDLELCAWFSMHFSLLHLCIDNNFLLVVQTASDPLLAVWFQIFINAFNKLFYDILRVKLSINSRPVVKYAAVSCMDRIYILVKRAFQPLYQHQITEIHLHTPDRLFTFTFSCTEEKKR